MDSHSFDAQRIADGYKKRPWLHPQVIEKIAQLAGTDSFLRGLDVGCGAGLSAKALKAICRTVIGTDISPEMIHAANEICGAGPELSFFVSSAEKVRLDAPVDIVTAAGAIQWIDLEAFLKNLFPLLSDHGFLAVYDFAVSDRAVPASFAPDPAVSDSAVPQNAYAKWWHEAYLPEFPKPFRNEHEWSDADVKPFGFQFLCRETLELTHSFDLDSFIEFMMIQSNVNVRIENGSKNPSDVRKWFEKTLAPIFQGGTLTMIFTGYLWMMQKC